MQLERNGSENKYLKYAYLLLSKKSYSCYALKEKLVKKGASLEEIETIIISLKEKGYLDDNRLIKEIVNADNDKLYGKYKILQKLKKQNLIPASVIDLFPYEIELDKAIQLISKLEDKYSSISYNNMIKKIHTYLSNYGYETNVISDACTHIKDKDDNNEIINMHKDFKKAILRYENINDKYLLKQKVIKALMAKGYLYNDICMGWEEYINEINK